MAVEFMESFGWLPDGSQGYSGMLGEQWISTIHGSTTMTVADLTGGRKTLKPNNSYSGMKGQLLNGGLTTFYFGFNVQLDTVPSLAGIFALYGTGGTAGWILTDSVGRPFWGSSGVETCKSPTPLSTTARTHLVFKVVMSQTVGSVEIWQDGVSVASVSGADTILGSATNFNNFDFGGTFGANNNFIISDLWVDGVTDHGIAYVMYDPCDTAGSSSDFTPTGAATNHEAVDEIGPDNDTTYNRSTVSTDLDQLAHGATPTAQTVPAVQAICRARKEAGGAATFKQGILHSGTHGQSADKVLSDAYKYYTETFEDVPGGTGWTNAQLQAAETTYENTA